MKQVVWKLFMNYENEEAWLNRMSSQGLHCIDYCFGRYVFEQGKPGEYIYRIQLLDNPPKQAESLVYLSFLEDAGIEFVASQLRWAYFRKKAADGPFELFSDSESRIAHYRRIIVMLIPIALANLFFGIRYFTSGQKIHLANLAATFLVALPIRVYYLRLRMLKKDSQIRE